jgi:CheY-like chemotaxis protein
MQEGAGPKILLVENFRDLAVVISRYLRRAGFKVAIAADGRSALLRYQAFLPDVVFCALELPDMDGYEVAQAIRWADGRRPALVALAAYAQDSDIGASLDAGFDRHMVKPLDGNRLVKLIEELARGREAGSGALEAV